MAGTIASAKEQGRICSLLFDSLLMRTPLSKEQDDTAVLPLGTHGYRPPAARIAAGHPASLKPEPCSRCPLQIGSALKSGGYLLHFATAIRESDAITIRSGDRQRHP